MQEFLLRKINQRSTIADTWTESKAAKGSYESFTQPKHILGPGLRQVKVLVKGRLRMGPWCLMESTWICFEVFFGCSLWFALRFVGPFLTQLVPVRTGCFIIQVCHVRKDFWLRMHKHMRKLSLKCTSRNAVALPFTGTFFFFSWGGVWFANGQVLCFILSLWYIVNLPSFHLSQLVETQNSEPGANGH